MGQKVVIKFWWESGSGLRLHPETISPLFADLSSSKHIYDCIPNSSLYPKQLSLFCLLWLISASADRIGYITSFCSMMKLLHELQIAVDNIEAFRHLITSQQGKRKTKNLLNFYT